MSVIDLLEGRAQIHVGDVIERLRNLPADSIDIVVTSPPYWGLRDYGTATWVEGDPECDHLIPGPRNIKAKTTCPKCGAVRRDAQIGLEPTLGEHIDAIVAVFAEIWRVLKPTGTVWLNYGDCYATAPNGRSAADTKAAGKDDRTYRDKPFGTTGPIYRPDHEKTARVGKGQNKGSTAAAHGGRVVAGGTLKPKDLCMVPNRLAIALQDWGWWVRSEIVWGKTNPMPDSSGAYRPSTAHEKIFMLTKSNDGEVWRARDTGELSLSPDLEEKAALVTRPDQIANRWVRIGAYYDAAAVRQGMAPASEARLAQDIEAQEGSHRAHGGAKPNGVMKAVGGRKFDHASGRPPGTAPHTGLEGAREDWRRRNRGVTPRHDGQIGNEFLDTVGRGQGRNLRNYEPAPLTVWPMATRPFSEAHFATFPPELVERCLLAGCPPDGVVLDPFGGAGTTALVALRMGRRCKLIELSPAYAALAQRRLERDWMGPEERRRDIARDTADPDPGPLFGTTAGGAA